MSDENFQLEYDDPGRTAEPSDADRVERIRLLVKSEAYRKIGTWDRDFLTDQVEAGRKHFSKAQRYEADRIWNQWREHV